jgi:molybdate transport system substrate-binding protein
MFALMTRVGRSLGRLGAAAVLSMGVLAAAGTAQADTTVFAAASTTNAMNDVIAAYGAKTGKTVVPSYASSSTLAKQIEQGAPAQIFLSANTKWMDFLAKADLLEEGSTTDLLGNSLVMIAPKAEAKPVTIAKGMDLAGLLGDSRLSVGDPDHVPAGIYAKSALEWLDLWPSVEPKLARASDVRGALALVERGEAPLGIVYSTDAAISKEVSVVGAFPQESYKVITYPAALVKGADEDAKAFFAFLTSDEAKSIFAQYGFVTN